MNEKVSVSLDRALSGQILSRKFKAVFKSDKIISATLTAAPISVVSGKVLIWKYKKILRVSELNFEDETLTPTLAGLDIGNAGMRSL